jgi:formiminoglutamate deiminase
MQGWHAELAWTGQLAERVTIAAEHGRIVSIEPDSVPPTGTIRLPGITVPGLVNPHSHALHRALRGRTQQVASDFWSWRTLMYQLADRLDPDSYHRLARAVYAEMALAGITTVGEFHYLHHDQGGRPYADPNAMGEALLAAAADAGIRLTLIDTCYLQSGVGGGGLEPSQQRFSDGDADSWRARVDELRAAPGADVAAAIHSVRAVDPGSMAAIAAWCRQQQLPLHVHASEQPRENAECVAATGMTPVALLAENGALGPATTVVHATHATPEDVELLGRTGTTVCLCPTTERDLADGVGPAQAFAAAGSPLAVASDMHAVIDMFEEMRALELDERLISGRRGLHRAEQLLAAATTAGSASLGRDARGLCVGAPADFTTVALDTPRTAGATAATALDQLVFAATAADVTDVVVAGRHVVEEGRHLDVPDVGPALATAIAEVMDESTTTNRAFARTN